MKILIIGGSGVISEYLTAITASENNDVYCFCRGSRKELIPKNVTSIYGNCMDKEDLEVKLKNHEFDVVVDFMSFYSGQLVNKLEVLKGKIKQYIFISSAVIFSETTDDSFKTEVSDKNNDLWDYSIGKIECEKSLKIFCNKNNIKYTIIRPYITYGNQRVPFQINSFKNSFSLIYRIMLGKPIVIAGSGENKCTLTHAEDFCRIMKELFLNPVAYDNDFNITSDESFSWNQIMDIIGKTIGIKPKPVYLPVEFIERNSSLLEGSIVGDKSRNMLFDNSKIKRSVDIDDLFGIRFEEGIKITYENMKNNKRYYQMDLEWDREMDQLIARYMEETGTVECFADVTEDTEISNIEIYRHNYIALENKYYALEKNFNWLNRLTSLDDPLRTVEDYFIKQNIRKIAVYGIGNFGKKFYEIISASDKIKVSYIIDMNVKEYNGIKVYNINDELDQVDAVVVTLIPIYNEIKKQLSERYRYRLLSLEDVL